MFFLVTLATLMYFGNGNFLQTIDHYGTSHAPLDCPLQSIYIIFSLASPILE
jgi:hypothetical protein